MQDKGAVPRARKQSFLNKAQKISGYSSLGRTMSGGHHKGGQEIYYPLPIKSGTL